MSHASWLTDLFDNKNFKKVANILSKKINQDKRRLNINCLVGMGISGISFASVLSYKTNLPLVIVRKADGKTHSIEKIEYNDSLESMNYCVIDDLIDTGSTVKEIYERMKRLDDRNKMIKIYLYHSLSKETFQIIDGNRIPVFSFEGL